MATEDQAADLNLDDDLTDEEREALAYQEPEEETHVDQIEQPTDDETASDPDAAPAADPDAPAADPVAEPGDGSDATAADPEPAPAPAAEPAAAQPEAAPAPAPILIAEAPADAQARLDAIAASKAELIEKYENGDLTAKEFHGQIDKLNDEQIDLKSTLREAELARKLEAQRQQNQWDAECTTFLASHKEYHGKEGVERYQALDEAIKVMARLPVNRGISGPALLEKAHRTVKAAYGEAVAAPTAPAQKIEQPKVPKPAVPPTNIGKLPQADANDTSGGEFAALDKLAKSNDVDAYEDAVSRLTPSARERYMRR